MLASQDYNASGTSTKTSIGTQIQPLLLIKATNATQAHHLHGHHWLPNRRRQAAGLCGWPSGRRRELRSSRLDGWRGEAGHSCRRRRQAHCGSRAHDRLGHRSCCLTCLAGLGCFQTLLLFPPSTSVETGMPCKHIWCGGSITINRLECKPKRVWSILQAICQQRQGS